MEEGRREENRSCEAEAPEGRRNQGGVEEEEGRGRGGGKRRMGHSRERGVGGRGRRRRRERRRSASSGEEALVAFGEVSFAVEGDVAMETASTDSGAG